MKTDLYRLPCGIVWVRAVGIRAVLALVACLATSIAHAAEPPKPKPPAAVTDAGKPVLGATMDEVDGKLQVVRVEAGGPADRAGLRRGDVVLSIGRDQVAAYEDLATALNRHRPQDKVAIVVERDGATRTLQAVLGDSRAAAAATKKAAINAAPGTNVEPEINAAEAAGPIVIDGQDLGTTAQGFVQMLRDATQGLRRSEPAGAAPAGRSRRPLLERLSGAAPATAAAAPDAAGVQVDLGQESGGSATQDLADRPATPGGQIAKQPAATGEAAAPRRALGTRPRPRLERLRDRLGKALEGSDAPAFEGGALQPNRALVEEPTPRVAGRQPLPEELLRPDSSQNRQASNQQSLGEKPALGVTLKLRDAGVVVSAITPGGAAEAAGLKVGDVLKRIDGRQISTVREATDYIATGRPGDEVELEIQRAGRQQSLGATLGSSPQAR